jgi:hypothetical protein
MNAELAGQRPANSRVDERAKQRIGAMDYERLGHRRLYAALAARLKAFAGCAGAQPDEQSVPLLPQQFSVR